MEGDERAAAHPRMDFAEWFVLTCALPRHVMPGLVPGISLSKTRRTLKNPWMPGTSPGMTA